jgi:hypothetical protein
MKGFGGGYGTATITISGKIEETLLPIRHYTGFVQFLRLAKPYPHIERCGGFF